MTLSVAPLFRPFAHPKLPLPNRIVMAPMTRSFSPGGVPGDDVVEYYRRRARNGVGLIITEGTAVAHGAAANDPKVPRFHGADALAGWAKVVEAVHGAGGKIMPQLWHVGTMRKKGDGPNPEIPPVGPSGLFKPGRQVVEPMTQADIEAVTAAFVQGAIDAKATGFDGIELHGAHGYLLDQFFWEGTNIRDDRYAGGIAPRTRFVAEIVRACRHAVGSDFPIILRFSQWKQQEYTAKLAPTPGALAQFLEPLADAGVDIFHCSTRRFWEPEFEGSHLNLAGWTKKLAGRPVITVGSVGLETDFITTFQGKSSGTASLDKLIAMMDTDEVDLVAVGRMLIVDPEWVIKVREGRLSETQPYSPEALKTLV